MVSIKSVYVVDLRTAIFRQNSCESIRYISSVGEWGRSRQGRTSKRSKSKVSRLPNLTLLNAKLTSDDLTRLPIKPLSSTNFMHCAADTPGAPSRHLLNKIRKFCWRFCTSSNVKVALTFRPDIIVRCACSHSSRASLVTLSFQQVLHTA